MLVKIISTATLILLAWLAVQILQTKQSLDTAQMDFQVAVAEVHAELGEVSTQNESISTDLTARMEKLSEEQLKLVNSSNKNTVDPKELKAKDQTINRLKEVAALQNAYANILKADIAAYEQQGATAAELLMSTKSVIWKTSDKWVNSKDALRGLMAPIDILAGKWERGDYSSNAQPIQKILLDVFNAQPQS